MRSALAVFIVVFLEIHPFQDGNGRLSRILTTLLLLQAGLIGAVLTNKQSGSFETASLSNNESITRDLGAATLPRALVRFAPDARVTDITALLDKYQASIIDGGKGGVFRLQFGNRTMTKGEVADLLGRLQSEKTVSLAVAAQ